ncbi:zinc finger and BTB domain-containing protein 43 [Paramormyrops kingsleyae]|uniref:Zinc finger and BTB domain containing 43 n=1 Tax=Paramormyrops kingsleyae TaxID=1676925 RepID=A0A3B3QU77_9TELE|nr:zinc finger and BTB domain-containing protein 43 [Paramormyrops kingsleyae]
MESEANLYHVEFPDFSCSILQKLNEQRQIGQLCDITVVIQGHRFRAHKAVLAASSPYFCDQVLLKNSTCVVLPDVMHPGVFDSLLQSCYTGSLSLPVGEIVGFLTAASFLQMWHVVDKCTELLAGGQAILCQKPGPGGDHPSPGYCSYNSPRGSLDLDPAPTRRPCAKISGYKDREMERLVESCFSPRALERDGVLATSPPSEQDHGSTEMASQDGEDGGSDVTEYRYPRSLYIRPSILYHKRMVLVKPEKMEQDGCELGGGDTLGAETTEELDGRDPEGVSTLEEGFTSVASTSSLDASMEEKLELEEAQGGKHSYDEPLDFYGASMEEFSAEKVEAPPSASREDAEGPEREDGSEPASGIREETSHSGFAAVVYKLYPCQCGKSFTHKSQRDRHMGMHLGLRPYGCAVCGKKFKMKHHLVGHMKIHTGVKPYECSICGKRFMWRDSFHRHVSSCTRAQQVKQAAHIC